MAPLSFDLNGKLSVSKKSLPATTSPHKLPLNRKMTLKSSFIDSVKCLCDTTSSHGFNYITNETLSIGERIFWFVVVASAIIVSIVLVSLSYKWMEKTPVITVMESSHYPAWNIPFPAVTLCNFNKISRSKALALAKELKRPANVTDKELISYFRMILYSKVGFNFTESELKSFDDILSKNNYTAAQLIYELSPNCMEMISKCVWKGMPFRCDILFQRINTTNGICCSFNYFAMKTQNYAKKLLHQAPKNQLRISGCGYSTGLTVLLNPEINDYYGTYVGSYGFRMLIHDGFDFPDENPETNILSAGRESFVRIAPRSTYATADVKKMHIDRRMCLLSNERSLSVMKRYSYINCLSECRARIFYDRCRCVPTNVPNNGSYPFCNFSQVRCIIKSPDILFRALPHVNRTFFKNVQKTVAHPCDCLPDCELNQYTTKVIRGQLNAKYYNQCQSIKNTNQEDHILLHVFFSDLVSTRYRMDTANNWLTLLASFGGLLGLIMGFSIVTAFEFIYYLTLRPIFRYVKDFDNAK